MDEDLHRRYLAAKAAYRVARSEGRELELRVREAHAKEASAYEEMESARRALLASLEIDEVDDG